MATWATSGETEIASTPRELGPLGRSRFHVQCSEFRFTGRLTLRRGNRSDIAWDPGSAAENPPLRRGRRCRNRVKEWLARRRAAGIEGTLSLRETLPRRAIRRGEIG